MVLRIHLIYLADIYKSCYWILLHLILTKYKDELTQAEYFIYRENYNLKIVVALKDAKCNYPQSLKFNLIR